MGYDVEFVQIAAPANTKFPVTGPDSNALLKKRSRLVDPQGLRTALLKLQGCRGGPGPAIDYNGAGLNYARLLIHEDRIFVENSCGARDLLKIYRHLLGVCPDLLILDLQSRQLHDADSLEQWWSRPL